jgi:hypothetical protein
VRLRHNVLDGSGRANIRAGDPVRGGHATSRTCVLRVTEREERVLT